MIAATGSSGSRPNNSALSSLTSSAVRLAVSWRPPNKALAKLTGLGFLKEVRVKHDQPLWRTDEEGKRLGLKITKAGSAAIGVAENGSGGQEPLPAPEPTRGGKKAANKGDPAQAERGKPRAS